MAAVLAAVVLSSCAGCGTDETPSADDCVGTRDGDITVLQGQPTDLPGGGRIGIAAVNLEEDPPTVNLGLGDAAPGEDGVGLGVGDVVTVQGRDYEVRSICPDTVDLQTRTTATSSSQ